MSGTVIIAWRGAFVMRPRDRCFEEVTVEVKVVDFADPAHCQAWLALLDMYAQDPMGGGDPLPEAVKARLCADLATFPGALNLLAWEGSEPVGMLNAFMGYSTFKARPLMNVHDIAVRPQWRGTGVGKTLLAALETHARERGCCKLTLEVLSGNQRARDTYLRFGFKDYALDPAMGSACFMQKWL